MKQLVWIFLAFTLSAYNQTPGNGVTDIDGNNYNGVIIGTQEWMKENLNVSKYSDGTIIPQVIDPNIWENLTTGAWCYYNNDPSNGSIYGKLYNRYAVAGIYDTASLNDPSLRKQIAPTGWHVFSHSEICDLITFLGANAGADLKETGTTHWLSAYANGTNSSGFTALPGGLRSTQPTNFNSIGGCGFWWTISEDWSDLFIWNNASCHGGSIQEIGKSVRCIKDIDLNNQSININSINIYPNPAKDQFTIDCSENINFIEGRFKIVNTLGQEVLNGMLNSQENIIQINNIKGQGVYFVKIYDSSNNLNETKKIIIQ